MECRQALQLLSSEGNAGRMCTYKDFYRGLVEEMSDDSLGEILGYNRDQLTNLFRKTFGPGYLDDNQNSLNWKCSALCVAGSG